LDGDEQQQERDPPPEPGRGAGDAAPRQGSRGSVFHPGNDGTAAALALAIGLAGVLWKSRRIGTAIALRPARRFALSFVPALLVGALLTVALSRAGRFELLPGVWLLTYGTGVIAGGTFSVPAIPIMGAGFLACGAAALFTPPAWGNIWMALGFGGLQVLFGTIIAMRYGG
jgi:hypothetical protein